MFFLKHTYSLCCVCYNESPFLSNIHRNFFRMKSYIITGAPGTGKTSIIEELSSRGYLGLDEIPRKLLKSKLAEKLGISPFKDLERFAQIVFDEMYTQLIEAQKEGKICFFDRALPDVFAYLNNSSLPIPKGYYKKLGRCHYEENVFICPPWQEIYFSDSIRPYPFEETLKLHEQIVSTYEKLSFNLIEVPKVSVKERTNFVINNTLLNTKY